MDPAMWSWIPHQKFEIKEVSFLQKFKGVKKHTHTICGDSLEDNFNENLLYNHREKISFQIL